MEKGLGTRDWALGSFLGLTFALMSGSVGFADDPSRDRDAEEMKIKVRLQDYAQVPRGTLVEAKREATRILGETGIAVTWLDCGGPAESFKAHTECAKPFAPTDLLLRILSRSMAERSPLGHDTFGFAQQSTDDRPAFAASVFYHRVEELAGELKFSKAQILGYVMAHEVGHLLLRTMVHSSSGIMRGRLSREDLLRPLAFTDQQAELIRADVQARIKGQDHAGNARLATTQ